MKYLFTAIYKDGTEFQQTSEDVSYKDPKRSAFFDVDQENLLGFVLVNEETKEEAAINLETGEFVVNGMVLKLTDEPVINRRLIYFRRHLQQFNVGEELSHRVSFHLGWQGNHAETGANIQHTIILE